MVICRFPPCTFVSLIAAIQAHLQSAQLQEHGHYQSIKLPKPVSKSSLSCQRSLTLAAQAGHQRQKKKSKAIHACTSETCNGYNGS